MLEPLTPVAYPLRLFNWASRRYITWGPQPSINTLEASSQYTTRLPDINESDRVNWQLLPFRVFPDSTLADVPTQPFLWWNPETQRIDYTATYDDYASRFSETALNRTWQLNMNAFTTFGNPETARLIPYVAPASPIVPYYTQGPYPDFFAGVIMSQSEWQALFDSDDVVSLPGLGIEIEQWGDGVTVTQLADGTLGVVSTATGGLLDIRLNAERDTWFWLAPIPQLDDDAIFQASQRETPTVFRGDISERPALSTTIPATTVSPSNQAGLDTATETPFVLPPGTFASALEETNARSDSATNTTAPTVSLETPAPTKAAYPALINPPEPEERLIAQSGSESALLANVITNPVVGPAQGNLSLPSPALEGRGIPAPLRREPRLAMDDPANQSEERRTSHRYDVSGKGPQNAEEQLMRRRTAEDTPDTRRLKAQWLRASAGF
jgi:hypothetical protein